MKKKVKKSSNKPRWKNRNQVLFTLCGMIQTLILMAKSDHLTVEEVKRVAAAFDNLYDLELKLLRKHI